MSSFKLYRYLAIGPLIVLSCGVAWLSGCAPDDGRIPVSGIVFCDGEPLAAANIAFIGGGGGAYATGSTDANGKFSVRAAPGVNKVSVAKLDNANADQWAEMSEEEQLAGTPQEMAEAMKNAPQPLVAQKYFNAETSGIEFDVQPGIDEVKIEVTK